MRNMLNTTHAVAEQESKFSLALVECTNRKQRLIRGYTNVTALHSQYAYAVLYGGILVTFCRTVAWMGLGRKRSLG